MDSREAILSEIEFRNFVLGLIKNEKLRAQSKRNRRSKELANQLGQLDRNIPYIHQGKYRGKDKYINSFTQRLTYAIGEMQQHLFKHD